MGVSTVTMGRHVAEQGAERIVLPHSLLLDEIALMVSNVDVQVETPVQTGAGLDCSRSRMSDLPDLGLGSRAGWVVQDSAPEDPSVPGLLDGASDCGLCDVPGLVRAGVAALQLPGRADLMAEGRVASM